MSKQTRKPVTAQEQLEMDIMAETELARLQRQYRIMDSDRIAFQEETTVQLQKQKRVLHVLQKEQADIARDLTVCESKSNKKKDVETCLEVQRLVVENDSLNESIRKQKSDLREIEYQIKKVNKDVHIYKRKQITDEQMQIRVIESQRTIEALQNKLDHYVKRFCTILTDNKLMREEIDHLLRERNLFNNLWEHHLEAIHEGKRVMMDLVEQATMAYDQREEWCHKLQALRLRAQSDLTAHLSEMRELFRQLDHDASLQDFLSVKGQRRIMRDLEKKEQMKRQQAKENLEKQLLHYKETLTKVQEAAEEEDISKLSVQFIKQEEENFALFNYVNELNHELETLTDNITGLYASIDDQKEINERRAEQQQDTIASLKAELEKAQEEERKKKQVLAEKQTDLEQMLKGIEGLFKLVKCDNTPLLNLLGETGTVTNYNVMVYLGILENKVTDLIKITNYKDKVLTKSPGERVISVPRKRSSIILRLPTINPCAFCAEVFMCQVRLTEAVEPKCMKEIKTIQYGVHDQDNVLHTSSECNICRPQKSMSLMPLHKRIKDISRIQSLHF